MVSSAETVQMNHFSVTIWFWNGSLKTSWGPKSDPENLWKLQMKTSDSGVATTLRLGESFDLYKGIKGEISSE